MAEHENIVRRFYRWLYRATSRPDERGEYSGGRLEGMVREEALALCKGFNGKVLEIGFGAGLFALKLASQEPAAQVWGVDTDERLLRLAQEKARDRGLGNLHLKLEDAARLSFTDNTFDSVVCINLFLNTDIMAITVLLKEMKRVCKPAGRLVFEFRNARNLLFVLKYRLVRCYDDTAPYPLYTYHPERIEDLLKELGLAVIRQRRVGFPIRYLAPVVFIVAEKK